MMDQIELRKATIADLQAIITLLSTAEDRDLKCLVLMPGKFRRQVIQSEIERGRFFVAVNKEDGSIIAQRKVFIVEDYTEQQDILANFFRCIHKDRELFECGFFNKQHEFIPEKDLHFNPSQRILYIYVGSAFTCASHRGKRINEHLNAYAYDQLIDGIYDKIRNHNYDAIALLYFVVNENYWRRDYLARPFLNLADSIITKIGHRITKKRSFYAYNSYKQDFVLSLGGDLVKLPDEHCRPGRGCILLYDLAGL